MVKNEVLDKKVYIEETAQKVINSSDMINIASNISRYITSQLHDGSNRGDYYITKDTIFNTILDKLSPEVVNKRGKITKRLYKLMVKEGYKLYYEEWFKEEGNNYISSIINHINASSPTICDITDSLNWNSGEFGDSNSCYWKKSGCHGRNYIRLSMDDDSHHKAIREYSINAPKNGTGRGWLYDINDDLSSLVLYNTYGTLNNDVSSTAKKCKLLLENLTGLSYNIFHYAHNKVRY